MPTTPRKASTSETLAKLLPALTVLAALGLAVAAYLLLFMPKLGRLVDGGSLDLAPHHARLAEAKAYQASLVSSRSAFVEINSKDRDRVQRMVPVNPDAQGLYVLLDGIARERGMVLASIDTSVEAAPAAASGRLTVRGTATISGGTYDTLKKVLFDLERSDRIIDVQSLVFSSGSTSFNILFRAYAFDERQLEQAAVPGS